MNTKRNRRPRFSKQGLLVASSNIVRVSLIRRFEITVRYDERLFGVCHSTLTFNVKEYVGQVR